MRTLLLLLFVSFTVGACHCGSANPTPVTLRIKNTSVNALFVTDSDGGLGLEVQEQLGGQWSSLAESLACECEVCSQICGSGCSCDDAGVPGSLVLIIPPGATQERQWGGVLEESSTNACGQLVGSTPCVNTTNIPADQTVQLHFCYALAATLFQAADDAGSPIPGFVDPLSTLCVDRQFQPKDGVVEVSPLRGSDCTLQSQCDADAGELCLAGTCTTICPANDFPAIGGSWIISVFTGQESFYSTTSSGSNQISTGVGFVQSASYTNNQMAVNLISDAGLKGSVVALLPPGFAVPLQANDLVSIKVIGDASGAGTNTAMVLHDGNGTLLFAADSAQGGPLLSPADTAPFTVTNPNNIVGCNFDECGKLTQYTTLFTGGLSPVELSPGSSAMEAASGISFNLLNAGDNQSSNSTGICKVTQQMPYVIVNPRTSP